MNILIAYCIGAFCILLPRHASNTLSSLLFHLTKYKHGPIAEDERPVRPIFAMIVGIVILVMTYAIDSKNAGR